MYYVCITDKFIYVKGLGFFDFDLLFICLYVCTYIHVYIYIFLFIYVFSPPLYVYFRACINIFMMEFLLRLLKAIC